MKAEWIDNDSGSVLVCGPWPRLSTIELRGSIARIVIMGGHAVKTLEQVSLEQAKRYAEEIIRKRCGEILVVISELPAIDEINNRILEHVGV